MAINFSAQFIVNEKTSTRVLRLTDTSTGFTLSKGNFIITFPDGTQVANTDFANPQITAPGGNASISLITDVDNTVLTGTYVITYVALNTSLNEFTKTETFDFNWEKPAKAIINDSDVVLPEVQFKDLTAYETSGSFAGTLTRNFYTTTPSTSEVGVITKTSVGDILTPVNASKYYEGIYLVKSDISVAYTHTSKSWLTIAYTDLLEETFDVREAPTQDELVALMNTYKDQIEAYKSTNPSQYEIMNEQYDLVLALYSHILARYQTSTLDGSKAILDQLLGLLPPTEPYTYKATQMLPFTINFSTSLTGVGTTGTLPKFTGTATLGDSIIRESGGMIGIAKAPTAVLDVSGTIKGTSIVKDGGTSAQFLKADGSVDTNTYLTTGSAAGSYQPLDADLTAIAVLAGAAGILTKVSANTWTLDTTSYQVLDADLTAIAALTGTSGILIKTAANTWSLDTATYQLADADLTAIAALSGTAGLLKKTAANTWVLDTSAYLTGITSGQITTALGYTPENTANKGVNNGYAGLDGSGKVPSTQLPSYVDDVLEYANVAALPTTGETGKIYITLDTNKIYRWSGSVYVEISSSAAVWGGITGTLANQNDLQEALDAKQATLTLTTTGTGGPATLLGATLNIPQYEGGYASQLKHQVKLGATIAKGKAVYVSSADGTNMIVSVASNASESTSSKTLGLLEAGGVTNDIVNVITEGLLAGLDTSTALAGDPVWLGTSGNLIFGLLNKPVAPAHLVFIGIVTRVQQNNGEIFVKVQNGFELNEIHDVLVGSYGTNDVLYRDTTTNLWKNASIATVLGYTPVSPTQLALKADSLNPVFTDNIYISGTNPRLYFTDTDSNPDYTIFIDSGNFYILNQTSGAYKLLIQETGNISAGVGNSMIATSFIRRGGTSDEFLMADGSVSTGAVFNYPGIGIAVSGGGGWLTSIDDNSVNWNAAYSARISSLTTTGNSGAATLASNVLNIPTYTLAGLGGQPAFASGTGFVKISGTTISYVNETYLTTAAAASTYLPLTGGTLTGPLSGTSATFSGDVSVLESGNALLRVHASTTSSPIADIELMRGTNTTWGADAYGDYRFRSSGGDLLIQYGDTGVTSTRFTLASTGAATFSGNVTAASFIRTGGTSAGFLKADGSVDIRTFVTTGALDNYLPLTGGALQNTASSGYVLSVTNVSETSSSNGLYVNIASGSTGTPFRVDRGGVSLITVNYLGATLFKSTITANQFIKANGTSSEYLMADGSVSSGALGSYLPLSGGTLTGALSGTSATFSGILKANVALSDTVGTFALAMNGDYAGLRTGTDGSFNVDVYKSGTGYINPFKIASTGAATFSSSVQATSIGVNTAPSYPLHILRATGSDYIAKFEHTSASVVTQGVLINTPNDTSDTSFLLNVQSASTSRFVVKGNGNVGIGTNNPSIFGGGLEIQRSSQSALRVSTTTGTLVGGVEFGYESSVGAYIQTVQANGQFSIYTAAANVLAMRITSGGNVGIGTPSPSAKLTVEGSLHVRGGGILATNGIDSYNTTLNIQSSGTNAMFIDASQRVGIGTTTLSVTGANLQVQQSGTPNILAIRRGDLSNTGSSRVLFQAFNTSGTLQNTGIVEAGLDNSSTLGYLALSAGTPATAHMRITSGGEVLINTTSDAGDYKLQVSGNVYATAYFESSDKRLKHINYLQNSETFGAAQFTWKDKRDEKNHYGYIAQEVANFIPDAVMIGTDGLLSVDYNQAHTFKIAKVEDELTSLKKRVAELESQLNLA